MSEHIEGLDALLKKLDVLDENLTKKTSKKVIKSIAKEIKEDMKMAAPVSRGEYARPVHGVDSIDVGKIIQSGSYTGTKIGFSTTISGHGEDYWYRVRG